MGLYDVAFLPSLATFPPLFLSIVVENSGPPHVLILWLGVMLPVEYFCFSKFYFCVGKILGKL